jgi:hypothetical protein
VHRNGYHINFTFNTANTIFILAIEDEEPTTEGHHRPDEDDNLGDQHHDCDEEDVTGRLTP